MQHELHGLNFDPDSHMIQFYSPRFSLMCKDGYENMEAAINTGELMSK